MTLTAVLSGIRTVTTLPWIDYIKCIEPITEKEVIDHFNEVAKKVIEEIKNNPSNRPIQVPYQASQYQFLWASDKSRALAIVGALLARAIFLKIFSLMII